MNTRQPKGQKQKKPSETYPLKLSLELRLMIKHHAEAQDRTMANFMRMALRSYCEGLEK